MARAAGALGDTGTDARRRLSGAGTTSPPAVYRDMRVGIVIASVLALGAAGAGGAVPARPPEPLAPLRGPAPDVAAHVRILAAGAGGPAFILDLDRGAVRPLDGLGPLRGAPPTLLGPYTLVLGAADGGVLVGVSRQACGGCATQTALTLVGRRGAVRAIATVTMRGGDAIVPAYGRAAVWLLRRPRGGACTLALVPGVAPATAVPCGRPLAATSAGVWIASAHAVRIVEPRNGRVRASLGVAAPTPASATVAEVHPLDGSLALVRTGPNWAGSSGAQRGRLRLVDLASGASRALAQPSWFGDLIHVLAQPHGSLVAVDFGSPAYPGPAQAEDLWILDTRSGRLTHVPGYPARVDIKFSDLAWTTDGRLVIVAQGGGRTVAALWRAGARTLPMRRVPAEHGYTQLAVLAS